MPDFPTSNPAQFIQGSPVLHVRDVTALATWFRDVLGFNWDFGDEAYAVVWRDNAAVHLVKDDTEPTGVHLFQWVRDVDACHAEVVGRGVQVAQAPHDMPYGLREFSVTTPGGLVIIFGQDID